MEDVQIDRLFDARRREDSIPAFKPGNYYLTDEGVFVPSGSDPDNSKATRGLKPSTTLRNFILYTQEGRCAGCGIPEWATSGRLALHRKQRNGLYSIYNVVAVCTTCHSDEHVRLKKAATL